MFTYFLLIIAGGAIIAGIESVYDALHQDPHMLGIN